jgi:hypothetical protein
LRFLFKPQDSGIRSDARRKTPPKPLAFVFGMVLAMAVTVLTITTLAAPPKPEDDSAAPIPPRATIYRPQHWNAY